MQDPLSVWTCPRVTCAPSLSFSCLHPAPLKYISGTLSTWSALLELGGCSGGGFGGLESGGLSLQTSLAESRASRESRESGVSEHEQLVPGSLPLSLPVWSEQPGVGVDLPCVWGSLFLGFSSQPRNEHRWLRQQRK